MFTYLRYFYAVSMLLILVAAAGIGMWIDTIIRNNVSNMVKQQHITLAHGFNSSVWQKHNPEEMFIKDNQGITTFQKEAEHYVANIDILQFVVFNKQHEEVFNSSNHQLYDKQHKSIQRYRQSFHNNAPPQTTLLEHARLINEHGNAKDISIIHTVIQIPEVGVIEIISDVSKAWSELGAIQWTATSAIIGIFFLLVSILILITKRAEAILAKQHEVNLELTAAAATAEAENRDKSQFLANISHELRTPLNAIIGFSEIIHKDAKNEMSETNQEYMEDIHHSGVHLLSLINDILDFSKAEAGKLEVELGEADINKLVISSMRLVIPRADEAEVTLTRDLPKEHIVGLIDAKKLKQVMLNLLSNAVKFTPPGGDVTVTVYDDDEANKIYIQVKDTGIGIAPKDIEKVMTPFGQVDSKLSRKYEGTGLGLPLSNKFVEVMGGTFTLESEVNVGTTVTLAFPRT